MTEKKDTPEQPRKEQDGQGTEESPDRTQPELTEQNLLTEELSEADDPQDRDDIEGELEDMQDDIQDANSH